MSRARLGIVFSIALIASLAGWRSGETVPLPASGLRLPAPDSSILKSLRWRNVGPDRGGRSIAIAGVRGQPKVGYFGATGGGLWKTTDGGEHWANITDGQLHSSSVGAVAVSETDPNIIFIGMGESEIRGDIQPGDGVYKSTDAGKTWTHIGFSNSDAISHIRIHPTNPNIVFVSDFGKFGVNSEERGVFKSTDGGKSWRKVLYKSPNAGGIDVEIDRTNPNVMYAALWEAYRKEWEMSSGGPQSGMYKSTDGGETWTEITHATGLPAGIDGKIGISVSPVDPNRVFAMVENENGGLYRSDDAGATWTLVNNERRFRQRAFYYTHVFADTKNKDLAYVENVGTYRSTDGGKTFDQRQFARGDSHDMWIDPDDNNHVLHAADPGGDITFNALADQPTWSSVNYPTAQLYHVVATAHIPFYVCGSQQDESETCMSAAPPAGGGRFGGGGGRGGQQANEFSPGGSEDGYIAPDPHDPDIFYSGTNANGGGFLTKLNRRTGEVTEVSPYPRMFSGEESAVLKERWQWTYPIIFSPVDGKTLYAGSQHLWKTTNGGHDWTKISPDLTKHDPKTMGPSGGPITRDMNGPEVYAVIFSIAPSKRTTSVIWTGSDDGLVEVTKDGGLTWTNVTPKDMPEHGRVSLIDAGAHDSATAYVAVKRFLLDDMAPYIYRTHDMGKTWTKIVNGIAENDFVHAVREDPTRKGLLYAGTQHGVYMSYDDGDHWESLSLNLPSDLPVWDLIVVDDNLAIATHGRSFYVLDHIEPLRQYNEKMMTGTDPVLFRPAPAIRGANQPATIQYMLRQPAQNVKIEVLDSKGLLVRSYPDTTNGADEGRGGGGGRGGRGGGGNAGPGKAAGMNTFAWDMRYTPPVSFPGMILWGGSQTGPEAAPGKYTVRLTADGHMVSQPLVVKRHPLHEATDADLIAQTALGLAIRDKVNEANTAVIQIRDLKKQVADRLGKSSDANLKLLGDSLTKKLSTVEEEIYQVRNQSGQDPLNFPIKLNNRLAALMGTVTRGDTRPSNNETPIFGDLKVELKVQTDRMQKIEDTDLAALNALLKKLGLETISTTKKPIA
jgi:photosystem II stability/assembly factor-like uncharacterized protein